MYHSVIFIYLNIFCKISIIFKEKKTIKNLILLQFAQIQKVVFTFYF
jgi:hypothetical protein